MNYPTIVLFLSASLLAACNQSPQNTLAQKTDAVHQDSITALNPIEETLKTIPSNIKPVFGYRFVVEGDFDGDGKQEKLVEHFISRVDNKECNKFYDSLPDYDQLVALTVKKKPQSFALSDNKSIDTLQIASGGQLLGLSYLKNEGDLNGDGSDEVSYVVNWADWSNLNTWVIMTYKNNKWSTIYTFPIWDSQIPDLPETFNEYGLFGTVNKSATASNDTLNKQIAEEFKAFKGLVKKINKNRIQVIFRNDDAEEDTMTVQLDKVTAH